MADERPPAAAPRLAAVLGAAGRVMIITGAIVLLFVVFQLWGTDIQAARAQDNLRDDLDTRFEEAAAFVGSILTDDPRIGDPIESATAGPESTSTTAPIQAGTDDGQPPTQLSAPPTTLPGGYDADVLAALFPEDGDALARIEMPSIDVDKVVVRGVAVDDLRKGPGHYSGTALPGSAGNAGIAGHRTTWGKPFNRIDELMPDDEIVVTTVLGEFRYRVMDPLTAFEEELDLVDSVGEGHIIVAPSAAWVLGDFGDDRLTLTACHPKLSSRQRIIVAAELIDDTVELPGWLAEANNAEQAALAALQLLPSEFDEPDSGIDATADDTPTATAPTAALETADDLDEGLNGERDAIPGAAVWMALAVMFWFFGGWAGRRWMNGWGGQVGLRLAGLVPAALCLWFSFELIDRALPAG